MTWKQSWGSTGQFPFSFLLQTTSQRGMFSFSRQTELQVTPQTGACHNINTANGRGTETQVIGAFKSLFVPFADHSGRHCT